MTPLRRIPAILPALSLLACGGAALRTEPSDAHEAFVEQVASAKPPIDPTTTIPPAIDVAKTDRGVVSLRAPVSRVALFDVVHRFFGALVGRNLGTLEDSVDDVVLQLDVEREPPTMRAAFYADLLNRTRALPYESLDVDRLFRDADIEIYSWHELGEAGRPARPASMASDDMLVRVHMLVTRVGADVLFADEVRFLLKRDGGRYRIRGIGDVVPR